MDELKKLSFEDLQKVYRWLRENIEREMEKHDDPNRLSALTDLLEQVMDASFEAAVR